MRFERPPVLHPYFFAAFPILYLLSRNMDEASFSEALKPLAVSLVFTILLYALLKAVLKNARKAGVILSIGILMFFSYGHVYMRFIQNLEIAGRSVGRTILFFPAWSLLFLILAIWIIRTRAALARMTTFLNIAAASLMVMSLVTIGIGQAQGGHTRTDIARWNKFVGHQSDEMKSPRAAENPSRPDIYYIIMDEYARADVLEEHYNFSNEEFIDYLKSKGFYVASRSRCNYPETYRSISSALNFDYLQNLADSAGAESIDDRLMRRMIQYNRTCTFLKKMGYRFVFFPSSYHATSGNPEADIVVSPVKINLGEFDQMLIETSMLRVLGSGRRVHRQQILFSFEELAKLPAMKEPTIAFVHMTIPHPPFLFDAQGNTPEEAVASTPILEKQLYVRQYVDQVIFANKKLREVIDRILSTSDIPPIIIVQGDHGPRYMSPFVGETRPDESGISKRRLQMLIEIAGPILNAYYLPDGGSESLYDSISPVNSFRVILNRYFGMNMDLLDDRCIPPE